VFRNPLLEKKEGVIKDDSNLAGTYSFEFLNLWLRVDILYNSSCLLRNSFSCAADNIERYSSWVNEE
jgi:hypothetical protein